MLLLWTIAAASPPITGSWSLGESRDQVRAQQQAAVERAIQSVPGIGRGLARRLIRKQLRVCNTLDLALDDGALVSQCTGAEKLIVPRPGGGTFTDDDGQQYRTRVQVDAQQVSFEVLGDQGGQRTTYTLEGDALKVDNRLMSPRLASDVVWTVHYTRR